MADPDSASAWQARLALATGDPGTAREISEGKAREGRMYGPQHALTLLEALVALADWTALGDALPAIRGNVAGNTLLGPHCDRAEGRLHAAAGRPRAAATALRRALAGFTALGVPFEVAGTHEMLAEIGPAAGARASLDTALAIYHQLGAEPSARAVRSRLAAAG